MKKQNAPIGNVSGALTPAEIKKLIVGPLSRRMERHVAANRKSDRRILKRLCTVESSVEIVARELARQARQRKGDEAGR